MTSRLRMFLRLTGIATAATVGLTLGAATAAAHSNLVDSNPADGDTVTELPPEIVMTFSDGVQDGYTEVAVLYDDTPLSDGDPVTADDTVTQSLGALPDDAAGGEVTVSFRIISADGHPVDGTFTFTVDPADSTTPTPAEEAPEDAANTDAATPAAGAATDDGSESGTSAGTLIALGVAVAAAIAMVGLWFRHRITRNQPTEGPGEGTTT